MTMKLAALFLLAAMPVIAQSNVASSSPGGGLGYMRATERIQAQCVEGRRIVCGKILRVLPGGLIVESGYTNLVRHPLDHSWLIPGTVEARREPSLVEKDEPDCACVGLVYLTETPRSRGRKPKLFDYVVVEAFPAGQFTYTSVGTIQRTVRRFSASLASAVRLNRDALGIHPPFQPSRSPHS